MSTESFTDPERAEDEEWRLSPAEASKSQNPVPDCPYLALLSARQAEVLYWIAEGKRDREIAVILGISYRTVTEHVRAILNKLGVENRTSAAILVSRSIRSVRVSKLNDEIE